MARNKINDLRDHLFSALERLDNDELTMEELNKEIEVCEVLNFDKSLLVKIDDKEINLSHIVAANIFVEIKK